MNKPKRNCVKPNGPAHAGKEREIRLLPVAAILLAGTVTVTAFADGDPLAVGQQLERLYLFPHPGHRPHSPWLGRGAGGVEFSISRPLQRSQGFLTLAGGLVITFAKEILDLITGGA